MRRAWQVRADMRRAGFAPSLSFTAGGGVLRNGARSCGFERTEGRALVRRWRPRVAACRSLLSLQQLTFRARIVSHALVSQSTLALLEVAQWRLDFDDNSDGVA